MRTTLTLDEDVLQQARQLTRKLNKPFKAIVNQGLRLGFKTLKQKPTQQKYVTKPHNMGLREGYQLDNIQELLTQIEGEESR